jgi:hypothetical protein
MAFELLKVLELCARAETTLDCLYGKVRLGSLEEHSMARHEFAGDLEKLACRFLFVFLRCVVDMMRCFPINTPLDPSQLSIRSVHHPTAL